MKRSIFAFLVLGAIFAGCSKDETTTPVVSSSDEKVITDQTELNKAMVYQNVPITFEGGLKMGSGFTLEATALSPTVSGVKLSATYVIFRNNKAYVTYHERGEGHKGYVRVYDVTTPATPVITTALAFSDIDINAADINQAGTKLYLAGSSFKKGAVLLVIDLDGSGNLTAPYVTVPVGSPAASANGVIQASNYLYVSVGSTNGGLYALNATDYTVVGNDLYDGASFSTANGRVNGKRHAALEGNVVDSKLHVYKVGSVDQADEFVYSVGPIEHQNVEAQYTTAGKSTIFMRDNATTCFIARGKYGMKAVDVLTGNLVYQSPVNMITYGNTNAVSQDNDYIYLANGAQGVTFATPGPGTNITIAGVWNDDLLTPASANFVASNSTHVFVANGKEGGLKILLKN